MRSISIQPEDDWLFLGDFNFYRSIENRNKPGGNVADTIIFNDIIGPLGIEELPLKGRSYSWSNMQQDPLLVQLDWFFTSVIWLHSYPKREVLPLAKITSDHIPCKVSIGTSISRYRIFKFENFWPEHPSFLETVQVGWSKQVRNSSNSATIIAGKLINTRAALKSWSKGISNLSLLISNYNTMILFLDFLEDTGSLSIQEWNLRNLIKRHLTNLLHYKNIYWKKRYTINEIKFDDECTNFFHAMATVSFRNNSISQLTNDSGIAVIDHESKAVFGQLTKIGLEFHTSHICSLIFSSSLI
jgi:hypothetical protein